MGSAVCRAVAIDPDLELVAAVDPNGAGTEIAAGTDGGIVTIGGELRAFADAACDVVVDFTGRRRRQGDVAVAGDAWCARRRRHHRVRRRRRRRLSSRVRRRTGALPDRAELRRLGGVDDALRRDGRTVLRIGGGHRTAPRRQGRRPFGHRRADRRADGRGVGGVGSRPDRARGLPRCARWARPGAASVSTRCGCVGWWRTRKSSSAPSVRR